jgi:hypothetical protein
VLKETVLAGVATAKKSVQNLAIPAKLVVRTVQDHIPGLPVGHDETIYDIKIVLSAYKEKEIDNDRIKANDLAGLIFPEDGQPVPEANFLVRYGPGFSFEYRIIANNKVMAGDTVALSQVQLRKT